MKLEIFAVRDRQLAAYMQPFFAPTIGSAIRAFSDGMNDGTTPMAKHPDDYDLWHLGSFNDNTGELVKIEPTQVAVGKNLIQGK